MANGDFLGRIEVGSDTQERAALATPIDEHLPVIQRQIVSITLQL